MNESHDLSRRDFTRTVAAAVMAPVLVSLAGCAPKPLVASTPPASAEREPTLDGSPEASTTPPVVAALTEAVRVQYGGRLTDEQLARVSRGIASSVAAAERLRSFPVSIATEPAFTYRVFGGAS